MCLARVALLDLHQSDVDDQRLPDQLFVRVDAHAVITHIHNHTISLLSLLSRLLIESYPAPQLHPPHKFFVQAGCRHFIDQRWIMSPESFLRRDCQHSLLPNLHPHNSPLQPNHNFARPNPELDRFIFSIDKNLAILEKAFVLNFDVISRLNKPRCSI
eukprot:CAMPEP_0196741128 /NCGR_PEP_ID=MMETSP1091-20130531/37977_1 /TAXON_ID=302021 /ORGANISM="Rhodomonas sp., Strain CCMP768" /LENGTH=157 /DNA_ID=CAMNT_0042086661 /DNA_START=123 /DNA_END=596 /DNA_ORIENTATION=-